MSDESDPIIVKLPVPAPGEVCVITTDGSAPVIVEPPSEHGEGARPIGERVWVQWDEDAGWKILNEDSP